MQSICCIIYRQAHAYCIVHTSMGAKCIKRFYHIGHLVWSVLDASPSIIFYCFGFFSSCRLSHTHTQFQDSLDGKKNTTLSHVCIIRVIFAIFLWVNCIFAFRYVSRVNIFGTQFFFLFKSIVSNSTFNHWCGVLCCLVIYVDRILWTKRKAVSRENRLGVWTFCWVFLSPASKQILQFQLPTKYHLQKEHTPKSESFIFGSRWASDIFLS